MKAGLVPIAILTLVSCEEPLAPTPPPVSDAVEAPEPLHLEVPPRLIVRARQEAAGLYRLPHVLRAQTLALRRDEGRPSYAELRADPGALAHSGVAFEGRVGFVRSAGQRLWILPLHTRREGVRWVDPLYVVSSIPPQLPVEGGAIARVYGFVVGERTIGQHALPLIIAYYVERLDASTSAQVEPTPSE